MREVISLHVGQFGIQSGNALWELYCLEQGICPDGELQDPINSKPGNGGFFKERNTNNYSPRAIFTDLEPSVIDQVRNGKYKGLHRSERLISGPEDAANNYARGRYTVGQIQLEKTMEAIRNEVENCDQLTGFMSFHSLGGGTGSGFTTLIDDAIHQEYVKKGLIEIALFPSQQMATSVVEPYNTILATHDVMNKTNCVMLVDNEAMQNLYQKRLNLYKPGYESINRLLAQAISATTCSQRFDYYLSTDFLDFLTNLVPFPRLHFPVFSLAPVNPRGLLNTDSLNIIEMTSNCFNQQYRMATCDNEIGLHMACCLMYRGDIASKDVHEAIASLKEKIKFVDWSPAGFKIGLTSHVPCIVPESEMDKTKRLVCMLCNNSAMKGVWQNLYNKYQVMASKGAFFHWYLAEGMEEKEFEEAGDDIRTLISDYSEVVCQ